MFFEAPPDKKSVTFLVNGIYCGFGAKKACFLTGKAERRARRTRRVEKLRRS